MNQQTQLELSHFIEHCSCALCGQQADVLGCFVPDPIQQHLGRDDGAWCGGESLQVLAGVWEIGAFDPRFFPTSGKKN